MPSTFHPFNYGTPAPLSLLETCQLFSRNFIFDSHRDLKLSRIQNVKFKYFSRSMDSFQGFFKTDFVFKDFSILPFIFKYFSSMCEPFFSYFELTKAIFVPNYSHCASNYSHSASVVLEELPFKKFLFFKTGHWSYNT